MSSVSTATAKSWKFDFNGLVGIAPAKIHEMNALKVSFSSVTAEDRFVMQTNFTENGREGGMFCLTEEEDWIKSTFFRGFQDESYHQLLTLLASAVKSDASIKKPFQITSEAFDKLKVVKPIFQGMSTRN